MPPSGPPFYGRAGLIVKMTFLVSTSATVLLVFSHCSITSMSRKCGNGGLTARVQRPVLSRGSAEPMC